jgi:hypothetical protein
MACLGCSMGRIKKQIKEENVVYLCDYCGVLIEYCHKCGAEIMEVRDRYGLILSCLENCGWENCLELSKVGPYSHGRIKSLMEQPPRVSGARYFI